jgi:hypothetical protein
MQRIRIAFSDFPGPFNPERITALLRRRHVVDVVERDPDYVIHSVFGHDYLRHDNAVRIFFTGENVRPDFNLTDYAFSYDWLDFGDRHFRAPNFIIYDQWRDIVARRQSALPGVEGKDGFCNFIYTNGRGHPIRDRFFHALNAVERVESFGGHLRNSDRTIGAAYEGDWTAPKVEAQRKFKFTIAFENSSSPGYTTEKLVHALAADTIPIYWGDPEIGRVFNTDRIIDMNRMSVEDGIERVMALHRDDAAWLAMANRPFFAPDAPLDQLNDDALLDAFDRIFSQPKAQAFRRNPYFWGREYEDRRRVEVRAAALLRTVKRLAFWR